MGEYILLKKLKIERNILFLCGPFEEETDKTGRRAVLQKGIFEIFNDNFLPLIIDHFLSEKKVNDDNINVQLLEEICAAISHKTYIFLDSISAATELGIFVNSAYNNKIWIFLPKESDIIHRDNVGYFTKKVVLGHNKNKVRVLEYRPSIRRVAQSTDHIQEYYGFINDKVPNTILREIKNDTELQKEQDVFIQLKKGIEFSEDSFEIFYDIKEEELNVNLSIKLLFYLTVSIIGKEYKDLLNKKGREFSVSEINDITSLVKKSLFHLICDNERRSIVCKNGIILNTKLYKSGDEIIRHIVKFVYLYCHYSRFSKLYIFSGKIIEKTNNNLYLLFDISKDDLDVVKEIVENKDKFYEKKIIKRSGKNREIVRYRNDENGAKARRFHEKLLERIIGSKKYSFSSYSYAYQKGKNIKQCVEQHISNKGFVKYDIKKFFNSIRKSKLLKSIMKHLEINKRYERELKDILETCYYNNKLPLGLVLSPILSDIFLKDFDSDMIEKLDSEEISYTRYADDIMISSKNIVNEEFCKKIDSIITTELETVRLEINEKKKIVKNLTTQGDYIRYVGLNLVCNGKENSITVGKKYIYETAKKCLEYNELKRQKYFPKSDRDLLKESPELFYERLRVIGRIGFIRQIEGKEGIDKLKERLKKYKFDIEKI